MSLYTNIPNKEGIRVAAKTLAKYRPGALHLTNQSLIRLLSMVLTKNNFEFNGHHYLQTSGTTMGTRLAPSHANNFMGDFENTHVYTYHTQPYLWLRFIDDIFMIWTHSLDSYHDFITHLNSCHKSIKFTAEMSSKHVNFLDTTVILNGDGTLRTTLYSKPTDSHNYLLYSSSHAQHCKNGLPFSQFLRVRRICSSLHDFDSNAITLAHHFSRRGYPQQLTEESIIKARRQTRDQLLSANTVAAKEAPQNTIYIITTYKPDFPGLKNTIQKTGCS